MELTTPHSLSELQKLVIRMERNNKTLHRLSQKINTYTCEPNDPYCFEKLYNLKHNFRIFVEHQNRIMKLMYQKTGTTPPIEEDIRSHLERFKQLEHSVEDYLLELNRSRRTTPELT